MNNHPTFDQPPIQVLSASHSKKRRSESSEEDLASLLSHLSLSKRVCHEHSRDQSKERSNNLSEEDLAQLPDLLSHLSVSKEVCQENVGNQLKSRSMITAATSCIDLDTAVEPENRTSIHRAINESSKHMNPRSYVYQRNPPKLDEGKHRRQPVSEDTEATLKPLRRRHTLRRVPRYLPGNRPRLVETNGCNTHPRTMPRLTDNPASLDGLPTELKLKILNEIPDLRSLDALIRASPLFSRAYFDVQEEVFNKQTFKELERRGLRLLPRDIDAPRLLAWLEVSIIGGGPPPPDLGPALLAFYNGLEMGKSTRLSMSHCKALLTVSAVIGWKRLRNPYIQEGPAFSFDTISLRAKRKLVYCPPEKLQMVYTRGVAHYYIYMFRFPNSQGQHFSVSEIETLRKVFALVQRKVFNLGPHQTNSVNLSPVVNRNLTEAQTAAAREVGRSFALYASVRVP